MDIIQLNREYGVSDELKFIMGNGNIPFIIVKNESAKALVSLYGAQVLSFQPIGQADDLLFVSKKAYYDGKKAIRGGIPVCWPWFGKDPEGLERPNHGFARHSFWEVSQTQTRTKETRITLQLIQAPEHKALWPHSFDLSLNITIGNTLSLELVTGNTGSEAFTITQALHSYFLVGNIEHVKVEGLEEHFYLDKLDQSKQKQQTGTVTINKEVDRIYTGVKTQLTIRDPVIKRNIKITSQGNKTAVVWNPWKKISEKMPDLAENDYQHFICLEAANAGGDVVEVLPDSKHSLLTNFEILRE